MKCKTRNIRNVDNQLVRRIFVYLYECRKKDIYRKKKNNTTIIHTNLNMDTKNLQSNGSTLTVPFCRIALCTTDNTKHRQS